MEEPREIEEAEGTICRTTNPRAAAPRPALQSDRGALREGRCRDRIPDGPMSRAGRQVNSNTRVCEGKKTLIAKRSSR